MPEEDILPVKFKYRGVREFDIPYNFSRFHHLQHGDRIHCILLDLENKNEHPEKIGEDVVIKLYDNPEATGKLIGTFQISAYDLYGIADYQYALLRMKKKIED